MSREQVEQLVQVARTARDEGRYEEALEALHQANDIEPTARAYLHLGAIQSQLGRPDAVANLIRAVELNPNDVLLLAVAANFLYYYPGREELVKEWVNRAFKIAEDRRPASEVENGNVTVPVDLLSIAAKLRALLGDDQTAQVLFSHAVSTSPTRLRFVGEYVDFLLQRERHDEALEVVEAALAANAGNEELDRLRSAIRNGEQAIGLLSQHP